MPSGTSLCVKAAPSDRSPMASFWLAQRLDGHAPGEGLAAEDLVRVVGPRVLAVVLEHARLVAEDLLQQLAVHHRRRGRARAQGASPRAIGT